MEITIIEAHILEQIMESLETLAEEVRGLCDGYFNKEGKKWISSQQACRLLGITLRTLQSYRDNGTLPYAQIGHKVFFRPEDLEKILNEKSINHGKE